MAHPGVGRLRGGGDHSDDEDGPDADLTLGIMANFRKKFEADGALGTKPEGGASRKKQGPVLEGDASALEDEARASKKRKKKGALDRLEKRERSRSSTPLSHRQDSEQESPRERRKKKRKAFHEVESAAVEVRGVNPAWGDGPRDGSSEEEGQIFEEAEERVFDARDGLYVAKGQGFSGTDNGLDDVDRPDTDLEIHETSHELRKESKVNAAGPSLEAPDSSPPREADTDAPAVPSGDTLTMNNLLRGRRYWDPPEDNAQRCFNCGATGHKAWNCPEPKKERPCFVCGKFGHLGQKCPTGKLCFVCGKGGHEARDCPKKGMRRGAGWASGEGQEGNVCYKCGWEGHTRAECWRDYDEADLQLIRCYICGEHGHLSCVDVIENGPQEVTCYQCGQSGHTGDGCARGGRGNYERDDGGLTCYRCGEKGHIARGCSKQNNFTRNHRPAYYERDVYRGGYNDRYDPDQDYDDLDAPEHDYFSNSRSQEGNEGLWLGGGYKAGSSWRDDYDQDDRNSGGVSRGSSKYGNRRYSDEYGYENRRKDSRYEEGYHGYNGDDTGRSKSTGRRPWQEDRQEERTHRRWGGGGREYQGSYAGHKRNRY
ncbi:hypothetical protein KFL_001280200 [Klebsormidium nitens]|uniref:CCHC-type domain-containing protein n=1 Tax=Klebsormidium nitens TaxID=105231 RepID=A0A1Y1HW80_KLENI|nr:hypothetical protein KFL_001280200 [Klebsormidium nitens]|eukprot:GAQ82900.1 hypothetical protein KFL_001280200 [Klebsormidium nitens]